MGNTASFMGGLFSVPDMAANVQDWAVLKYQGDQQRQAAEDANRFSERMSSTSWQRGVQDMRKAGINPMLSFSQGGASSPIGQAAQVPDYGRMVGGSAASFGMSPLQTAQKRSLDAATLAALGKTPNTAATRDLDKARTKAAIQQVRNMQAEEYSNQISNARNAERLKAEQDIGPGYRTLQAWGDLAPHASSAMNAINSTAMVMAP